MDSHLDKNVFEETHKNMKIHSYRDVDEENTYKKNMDNHLDEDVRDKNP